MPKIRDGALTPKQRAFVEIFVKEKSIDNYLEEMVILYR